ncbi:MAG: hypothetical protein HY961_02835 [Ignavibacteriae bacterium]|nr:hypothetical protein [Ignavibacteriota bacterium]
MSRAFVRENDDQWLHDVAPTMSALLLFLTRENNGIRVIEERSYLDADGREVHVMSNGLSYAKDAENKWRVVEE